MIPKCFQVSEGKTRHEKVLRISSSTPCSKYQDNLGFSKTLISDPLGFVWVKDRESGGEQREGDV